MAIILKNYQRNAVNKLKVDILQMFSRPIIQQKIVLKAPTGAGKTIMASTLLDELFQQLRRDYKDVAFIWLAPRHLHIMGYMSMLNYFTERRTLAPVMFDDIDVNDGLQPGNVLFLNWESINKENAVLRRDSETNRNIKTLVNNTVSRGVEIMAIIDEEHMFVGNGANAAGTQSLIVLNNIIKPKVELRISATPTTGSCPLIDVPRVDVIAEGTIKKGILLNPDVKSTGNNFNYTLLEEALKRTNALRETYHGHGINPLLLIQLPNDNADKISGDEKNLYDNLISWLAEKNITEENGKLGIWLSGHPKPEGIEERNNPIQVLLFKLAIATGWDCPRASVLLVYRNVQSRVFTEQMLGRIMRMPDQHHYDEQDELNYGYVYTNTSQEIINVVRSNLIASDKIISKRNITIQQPLTLWSVYQNTRKTPHVLKSPFKDILKRTACKKWGIPYLDFWTNMDKLGNPEYPTCKSNKETMANHGIKMDVPYIMEKHIRDANLTGDIGTVDLRDNIEYHRVAESKLLIDFDAYCRLNTGDYEPGQSMEMIRSAFTEFFSEFFGLNKISMIKDVLYYANKDKFAGLIAEAISEYDNIYKAEEEKRDSKKYVDFLWTLPETRVYDVSTNSERTDIFKHALMPYYEQNNASNPEKEFSKMLDENSHVVEWWYKNADSGHMHFAIPYDDVNGDPRCFYVDYIVKLKNGTVCLFDTKTKGSDPNAANKHNALLKYIESENSKHQKRLMGGVIIKESEQWKYSPLQIDNTTGLQGWSVLLLDKINVE